MATYITEQQRYLTLETMRRPDQAKFRVPKPNPKKLGVCRWCSGQVVAPRRGWCGDACVRECLALQPRSLRRGAWLRDRGKCALCCSQGGEWEADHTIPFAEGGLNLLSNVRTLCKSCHDQATAALATRRAARRLVEGPKAKPRSRKKI